MFVGLVILIQDQVSWDLPQVVPITGVHHVLAQLSETTPLGQDLKQAPFTPKPRTMVVCV